MSARDLRAAIIAAGAGLAIVVALAGIGLLGRVNMHTSGGGEPQDGDTISIPVAPDAQGLACDSAQLAGRLVTDPVWGITVRGESSPPTFWPHGYMGRIAGDRVELLDDHGEVVARTGDRVEVGGGLTTIDGREGFAVCPEEIRVEPAAP